MTASLSTDIAIKKWKPTKSRETRSVGGRDALYVRCSPSGAKAFYLRPDKSTWLKLGDYPAVKLASAREIALVAKRLRNEGFGTASIKKGLANSADASTFEKVVRGEVLGGVSDEDARVPTYDDIWREWFADIEPHLQEGPSRRRPRAIHEQHINPAIGKRPINEIRRRELYGIRPVSPL